MDCGKPFAEPLMSGTWTGGNWMWNPDRRKPDYVEPGLCGTQTSGTRPLLAGGCLVTVDWLAGWFTGGFVGWLCGWLAGWLSACSAEFVE